MDWICTICGYRYRESERGKLPDDYICPLCGADLRAFALLSTETQSKN